MYVVFLDLKYLLTTAHTKIYLSKVTQYFLNNIIIKYYIFYRRFLLPSLLRLFGLIFSLG